MKLYPTESKKEKFRSVYSGKASDSTFGMWLAVILQWSFEVVML